MAESSDLAAEAVVPLAAPHAVLARLARRLAEHATVTETVVGALIESKFGTARLTASATCLRMRAEGHSDTALSVMKMVLAEHLVELADDAVPDFTWTGHDASRHDLPYFRAMIVAGAEQVTPHMRRLFLQGDLYGLDQDGLHVRLLIPPKGRRPVWPHARADGRIVWPSGADRLAARVYTIRGIERAKRQIAVDFVLHPESSGPGCRFAQTAQRGDPVGVMGPGGGMPDAVAGRYLFLGDETALPAIARMVEALPASAHATIRIEVGDPDEEQPIASAAVLDLVWLHRNGRPPGTTSLLEDAAAVLDGSAWGTGLQVFAGCEHSQARALRQHFAARGLDRKALNIAGYWRQSGQAEDI
ncbi:siderophore-interacting protein [Geminicoccus flavidas]|uniref:siderophore-interacting protein n=1 Tax=Geminicoccus flavidas TaxID=2506407 RepID=UPI00135B2D9A|nr:siderophore-interacting protein [Geminicoccus flavidas]